MPDHAREVRRFWFGDGRLSAQEWVARQPLWFGSGVTQAEQRARDEDIRSRFEPLVRRALAGELAGWADSPRRRLSLILLLDQLPRNIYRGTPEAFAGDSQALVLALSGIQSGADAALEVLERVFFYMPLQHAEVLEAQEESLAAYRRLRDESPPALRACAEQVLEYAEVHRRVIERFGRFPHRNVVLGRASTQAELRFLSEHPAGF